MMSHIKLNGTNYIYMYMYVRIIIVHCIEKNYLAHPPTIRDYNKYCGVSTMGLLS